MKAPAHSLFPRPALLALTAPVLLAACSLKPGPLEGLRSGEYWGGDVRSGSLTYAEQPPLGGPYNALWQACGTYTAPLFNEYAVHSLARGAVWATYDPSLGAEGVAQLRGLLEQPLSKKAGALPFILSPLPGAPQPVVLTVWNWQIGAERPDDPRLARFLREKAAQNVAPESGLGCQGGFRGTRPALP